jgi:hypothetical protein
LLRGKFALFKEIFSPTTIFNQDELNPNHYISESQWIQQVFHGEEEAPAFSDLPLLEKHMLYQEAILSNETAQREYDVPLKGSSNDINLSEVFNRRNEIPLSSIRELFNLSNPTWLESDIIRVYCHLLNVDIDSSPELCFEIMNKSDIKEIALSHRNYLASISSDNMFRKMAFYDKGSASDSVMITIHVCRGAVLIRDLIRSMLSFASEFKAVTLQLESCKESLTRAKEEFDSLWLLRYSDNLDLWSIEEIIRRFQVF